MLNVFFIFLFLLYLTNNLCSECLVTLDTALMQKSLQFKSSNPLIILKTCIISPLVRLNFKDGSFKNSNLSPCVNVLNSNSNLIALRCTFSTEVDCFRLYRDNLTYAIIFYVALDQMPFENLNR